MGAPISFTCYFGRTFIQTGLFIVAHDAIHGVVLPSNRRLNDGIGQLVLTLYALLPYEKLAFNHSASSLESWSSERP